jgi:hypothetical protein
MSETGWSDKMKDAPPSIAEGWSGREVGQRATSDRQRKRDRLKRFVTSIVGRLFSANEATLPRPAYQTDGRSIRRLGVVSEPNEGTIEQHGKVKERLVGANEARANQKAQYPKAFRPKNRKGKPANSNGANVPDPSAAARTPHNINQAHSRTSGGGPDLRGRRAQIDDAERVAQNHGYEARADRSNKAQYPKAIKPMNGRPRRGGLDSNGANVPDPGAAARTPHNINQAHSRTSGGGPDLRGRRAQIDDAERVAQNRGYRSRERGGREL